MTRRAVVPAGGSRAICARLAVLLFCVFLAPLGPLSAAPPAAGGPVLRAETLDGGTFSFEALRGKVVVLDFWAPWCIPCRKSFPFLDALQERYGAQGLAVVGLTAEERREPIDDFLDDVKVRFQVLRDFGGQTAESLGVAAMPTTFLLDREGRVIARFEGGDEPAHRKLEEAVKKLLAGQAVPPGTDVRVAASARATGEVKAWDRGYLADPLMNLDGDWLSRVLKDHIHASKEGAAGDGGAAGGGCGCN